MMNKKWSSVPEERRKQIFAYNKSKNKEAEKAEDLTVLLSILPIGIIKQLINNEKCKEILNKYNITEE